MGREKKNDGHSTLHLQIMSNSLQKQVSFYIKADIIFHVKACDRLSIVISPKITIKYFQTSYDKARKRVMQLFEMCNVCEEKAYWSAESYWWFNKIFPAKKTPAVKCAILVFSPIYFIPPEVSARRAQTSIDNNRTLEKLLLLHCGENIRTEV